MSVHADIVIKVACHMIEKYSGQAARRAEERACYLKREPSAAARWRLVAYTIGMLNDGPNVSAFGRRMAGDPMNLAMSGYRGSLGGQPLQ